MEYKSMMAYLLDLVIEALKVDEEQGRDSL
jgi:hypothetical protein